MNSELNDFGAKVLSVYGAIATAVAAGTGDNTLITGATVDAAKYRSGKIMVPYTATLASGETLNMKISLEHSPDNFTTTTAVTVLASSVILATGLTGGTTFTGVKEYDFDRQNIGNYIRAKVHPDLSASGTDTAKIGIVYAFSGAVENPISATL